MGPAPVVEELPFFEAQGEIGISQVRGRIEFDPVGLLGTLHLPVEMGSARGNGAELDGVLPSRRSSAPSSASFHPDRLREVGGELGHLLLHATPQVADPRGPGEMLPAGLGEALDGVEGEVVCAQLARCEPAGDERSVIVGGDGAVDRAGAGLQR
jgi:hypothetical protein